MCIDISFFNIMDVHDNIMDVVTLIMVQVQSIRLDTIYLICLLKFTILDCSLLKHSKQKHKLYIPHRLKTMQENKKLK